MRRQAPATARSGVRRTARLLAEGTFDLDGGVSGRELREARTWRLLEEVLGGVKVTWRGLVMKR